MGLYKKEMNRLIEKEEFDGILLKTLNNEHKVLLILLYLTGARPSELVQLKKLDFVINGNDLRINLKTTKRGYERILPFDIDNTPYIKEILMPYINQLGYPEQQVFSFKTDTRVRQIVYKSTNNTLCPYNFRRNRLSRMGIGGATEMEIMYWKGAKDSRSVSPYMYRNPSILDRWKKLVH